MEFIRFKTGKDDEGRRLDRIAKKLLSEENLSQLYKALRNGLIKVNEKKQKGEYRIQKGDEIKIASFLAENAVPADKKNQEKITLATFVSFFLNFLSLQISCQLC